MGTTKQSAIFLATLVVMAAGGARAQSHLNRPPEQHLIVSFFGQGDEHPCPDGGGQTLWMRRVLWSGQQVPFQVPFGYYMVITDFDLTTFLPGTFPDTTAIQTILRLVPAGSATGPIVYRSSYHLTSDMSSKNYSTSEQSLAGILVGPGAALCPEMALDDSDGGLSLIVTSGTYRGYLIPQSRYQASLDRSGS